MRILKAQVVIATGLNSSNKSKKNTMLDEVSKKINSLSKEKLCEIGFSIEDKLKTVEIVFVYKQTQIAFSGKSYESAIEGIVYKIANTKNGLDQINFIMKQASYLSK